MGFTSKPGKNKTYTERIFGQKIENLTSAYVWKALFKARSPMWGSGGIRDSEWEINIL